MFDLIDVIKGLIGSIKKWLRRIINGVLNFQNDILNYLSSLNIDFKKNKPFIAQREVFKDLIKSARVKNVGLWQGVYNEQSGEIENLKELEADGVDEKTRNILGNDELVILN